LAPASDAVRESVSALFLPPATIVPQEADLRIGLDLLEIAAEPQSDAEKTHRRLAGVAR
jgi:hypothetical protein